MVSISCRNGSGTSSTNSELSGNSDESTSSGDTKYRVEYIDEPDVPSVSTLFTPTASNLHPYTPAYSNVLIKESEVETATLALNLGDKYRESYSTPRTFTLDLSAELGATAGQGRFYMVMVQRAEGKELDQYR